MEVLFATVLSIVLVCGSSLPLDIWHQLNRTQRDITDCQPSEHIQELFSHLNLNSSKYFNANDDYKTNANWDTIGTETCPDKASDNADDPLRRRSLCPWYYNITELPSGHYPRFIPQAVCKCTNCISSNIRQCERLSTKIPVLKETGCQNGFKTFKVVPKIQYVGCTCAERRIQIVKSEVGSNETGFQPTPTPTPPEGRGDSP